MPENNFVETLKGVDKKQIFFLIVIFALAFGTRAHLFKYDYMFGFDTYYHARMAGLLVQEGSLPDVDPQAYYFMEEGGGNLPQNRFFWYFTAGIYNITTLGAGYDKELWISYVKFLPALFGALTSIALFFVGKELYDKRAGYVMAMMAAIVPSFVYRTLAGFFEEDSLGFLWMVIGLVFFVRAVKNPVFNRKGLMNAGLAGVFFGIMAITWEMFILIPLVLGLYLFFAVMHIYTKMGWKKLVDFVKLYAISVGIFSLIATVNYGTSWINSTFGYATQSVSKAGMALGLPEGVTVGLALVAFLIFAGFIVYLAYSNKSEAKRKSGNKTVNLIATILLYVALMALLVTFLTIPNLFQETSVLGQTVGEENTGSQFFGIKYNALIVFPALALLLIPIRLFRSKKDHLSTMIFFWIIITLFMAWYKLKFTYTFGLPIAAAAGVITAEIFHYLESRTKLEQKTIALTLGFMLLIGISAATIFVPDKIPHISQPYPDWRAGLEWMQDPENIPADAKMFNWWDYGHLITFIGERRVSSDNRNLSGESNIDFAKFVITDNLDEAIEIARKYDIDYVILSSDMFMKTGSFGNYAYDTMDSLGTPDIAKFLITPRVAILCNVREDQPGVATHVCGNNTFSEAQMQTIPATWTDVSNQVYTRPDGITVPMYIYRAEDNSEIYFVNPATNNAMLSKLWFKKSDAMQYFEEAYAHKGIRLFKFKE